MRIENHFQCFKDGMDRSKKDKTKRKKNEQQEITNADYILKETAADFQTEIKNKLEFLLELNEIQELCE